MESSLQTALDFVLRGGPAMIAIAGLSVLLLALVLWKSVALMILAPWRRGRAQAALLAWAQYRDDEALALSGRAMLGRFLGSTIKAVRTLPEAHARERAEAAALSALEELRAGARALDLIATIAPLLGLLGTVLGMIGAFQALQEAGSRADPAVLAGGIWEALLTTAAGMAVAIPATVASVWLDGIAHRAGRDMEAAATAIFTRPVRRTAEARAA
ncbi:MAG: MotA/TolQ/ExbB proton channel family protein [Pseudomonadota bacterium]